MTYRNKTFLYTPEEERLLVSQEFIEKNNFKLRSYEEILQRFKDKDDEDFFGNKREVLSNYIKFDDILPFVRQDYLEEFKSKKDVYAFVDTIEECTQDFLDYMNFAWGKAVNERGLSASRSIAKLSVWLWLVSRDDLSTLIESDNLYNPYGAPALVAVCEKLNITVPKEVIEFSKIKQ